MPVTNYYTVNGELIGEKPSGGSRVDYLPDALGSVVATANPSGQTVNTYRYKPYGGLLAKTGAGADPAFRWVGKHGYRQTGKKWSDVYVRARHYDERGGRWNTRDPIGYGDGLNQYQYSLSSPIGLMDRTGTAVKIIGCNDRDRAILDSLVRQLCHRFHRGENQTPGWSGVEDCIANSTGSPFPPGFGSRQKECLLDWCRTGIIYCDNNPQCRCDSPSIPAPGGYGPPVLGETSCACSNRALHRTVICTQHAMPGGKWNSSGCGCLYPPGALGGYLSCNAPQCQGREGFFTVLHEIMHLCETRYEGNADIKACCILESLFDVIYPPKKCERGTPVPPGLLYLPL